MDQFLGGRSVELEKLRPFSDIGGRYIIKLTNSTKDRQELAIRLRDAGCSVNLDSTDWHTDGDFDKAIDKISLHT